MLIFCIILFLVFMLAPTPTRKYTFTSPKGQVYCLFSDMLKQSHLLIAGATGSGKSVAMNGLIDTLLYRLPFDKAYQNEDGAQMILIDPKRVELARYKNLPHVLDYASGQNPEAWLKALNTAVSVMDRRYKAMEKKGELFYSGGDLFIFIDEWASINSKLNPAKTRNACVAALLRLVQEGRAAKVHVIMATQVPKSSVIPTEVRDNFTARLALMTENKLQSRVIIDESGCEEFPSPKLAGYALGMYCLPGNQRTIYEIPYVKEEEIESNLEWWKEQCRKNHIRCA